MKSKFFSSIFVQKQQDVIPARLSEASDTQTIKPAQDILTFEYPPESPFYEAPDPPSESAGELHPNT